MGSAEKSSARGSQHGGFGYRPKLVWNSGVQEYLSQAYGSSQFAEICLALTRPCITSTVRVNTQQTTTQEVIKQLQQHFLQSSAPEGGDSQQNAHCRGVEFSCQHSSDPEGEFVGFSNDGGCETFEGQELRTAANRDSITAKSCKEDMCWEHPILDDVVMVRGHGPCVVDCKNDRGEPLIKEVVVSRKCAEAVLRGANVR